MGRRQAGRGMDYVAVVYYCLNPQLVLLLVILWVLLNLRFQ
jgi:hypothetical protein